MTTTADRSRTRSASPSLLGVTLPQVNLLPPEVRAARGLRVVQRWLAVALVVTLLLCVGAFGLSMLTAGMAASDLEAAQARTVELQTETGKYAEVPQVLDALAASTAGRQLGMSTEVRWKSYLDAVTAVLPENVSIESMTMTGATPLSPAVAPADILQPVSAGQLEISGRTATLPDTAAWIDSLNSVPGFVDARVSSAAVSGEDGTVYYTVAASVQYTALAYSNRFADVAGSN